MNNAANAPVSTGAPPLRIMETTNQTMPNAKAPIIYHRICAGTYEVFLHNRSIATIEYSGAGAGTLAQWHWAWSYAGVKSNVITAHSLASLKTKAVATLLGIIFDYDQNRPNREVHTVHRLTDGQLVAEIIRVPPDHQRSEIWRWQWRDDNQIPNSDQNDLIASTLRGAQDLGKNAMLANLPKPWPASQQRSRS